MQKFLLLMGLIGLLASGSVAAQPTDNQPYLYYYSRMLGGIIVERPDGSDSRLIGADAIPPDMSGIDGPGWSPSGKYFAVYGLDDQGEGLINNLRAYVMDRQGHPVKNVPSFDLGRWGRDVPLRWSPTGEDLLLIVRNTTQEVTFAVFDPSAGQTLVGHTEYGLDYASRIVWETAQQRIRLYAQSLALNDDRPYQITMQFDGTVLKEPVAQAEFNRMTAHFRPVPGERRFNYVSPSGDYQVEPNPYFHSDVNKQILYNNVTGDRLQLPVNSRATVCDDYHWNKTEAYLLVFQGTSLAGGGCGYAAMGVTDNQGRLWRELGVCEWTTVCAAWLPPQIDVATLPPGQPKPVQLDPVAYEKGQPLILGPHFTGIRLSCGRDGYQIEDQNNQEVLYRLQYPNGKCAYNFGLTKSDTEIVTVYNARDKLVAVYDYYHPYVTVWSMKTDPGVQILRLNTSGYMLEFTPDGQQLFALNLRAWKIYTVSDILAAARASQPP